MLRDVFEERYDQLVAAWSNHQRLRRERAHLEELAASRQRLDALRDMTNATRRAFAPDARETQSILKTIFCDRLEETVFLYMADASWGTGDPRFVCACGDPIDGEGERILV